MNLKLSRFFKTVLTVASVFVFVFSTQLSTFAVHVESPYKYNDNANYEIIGLSTWWPKGEITIPSKATGIKSGAFKNSWVPSVNVSKITKVIIPASVRYIESGAFSSDCSSLSEVVIQNSKSNINVAEGAFPSGASVTYTIEETTQPPTTTTPPTTAAPTTTAPAPVTKPSTQVPATVAPPTKNSSSKSTTKRKNVTTTKSTTSTTADVTEVEITEQTVPLAEPSSNSVGMAEWNELLNSTQQKEANAEVEQVKNSKSKATKYAISASAVTVTFAAIALTYLKFKR